MPEDKPNDMIKIQRSFRENALDVNESFIFFCFTVESIERDIDGKLFGIFKITTVYIRFPRNMSAWIMKSHSFDRRRKNVSQKHISP